MAQRKQQPQTSGMQERYRYQSDHQRILKSSQHPSPNSRHKKSLYLSGVDIHVSSRAGKKIENLCIIKVNHGRILYWLQGKPEDIDNQQFRHNPSDHTGSIQLELNMQGQRVSHEKYYPYGGTAIWASKNIIEDNYKTLRYSGQERDDTGCYYFNFRYYAPWIMRWLSPDPAGPAGDPNLYRMVANNPVTFKDEVGLAPIDVNKRNTVADYLDGAKKESEIYIGQQDHSTLGELFMEKSVSAPKAVAIKSLHNLTLAQNAIRTTKELLPWGATNMMMDIWRTNTNNIIRRSAAQFEEDYDPINTAIKYGVGNCGENAHITFNLLAWQGLDDPIHLIADEENDHSYVLIGDMRESNQVVVADSWVILPITHMLHEGSSIIKPHINDIIETSAVGYKHDPKYEIDDNLTGTPLDIPTSSLSAAQMIKNNRKTLWNEFTSLETVNNTYECSGRVYRFDQYDRRQFNTLVQHQRAMYRAI